MGWDPIYLFLRRCPRGVSFIVSSSWKEIGSWAPDLREMVDRSGADFKYNEDS
jgi:hypothetical protein